MHSFHPDSLGKVVQIDVMERYDTGHNDLDALTDDAFQTLKEHPSQNEKLSRLLENEMLQQGDLLTLSKKQLRNVMHYTVYWLMRYKALNITQVIAFSDAQYEIFSSICVANDTQGFAKIIAKLHALTEQQVKVLKSPNVAWLLRCKAITPDETLQITEDLLSDFDELNFSRKELFYSEQLTLETQLKFLMMYFLNKWLPAKEVLALEDDKRNIVTINLRVERLKDFLINGAITWDYLTKIAPSLLIESLPAQVVESINSKTISLTDELASRTHIIKSRKLNVSQMLNGEDYAFRTDNAAIQVKNFIKIYTAMRVGQSSFLKKSDWVKANKIAELPSAKALEMILEHAKDKSTRTYAAWALCAALSEDPQTLAKNIYLYAFKQSHVLKKSNAFGQTFYSASALQRHMEKNPQLQPTETNGNTRMNKMLQVLR